MLSLLQEFRREEGRRKGRRQRRSIETGEEESIKREKEGGDDGTRKEGRRSFRKKRGSEVRKKSEGRRETRKSWRKETEGCRKKE